MRAGGEDLVDADGFLQDPLLDAVADDGFEHKAIRFDAVGQRIARDLPHLLEGLIGLRQLLQLPRREALHVESLGGKPGHLEIRRPVRSRLQ